MARAGAQQGGTATAEQDALCGGAAWCGGAARVRGGGAGGKKRGSGPYCRAAAALACGSGVGRPADSAARITAAWRVRCAVEGKKLPSGAHGSAGEARSARLSGESALG